MISVVVALVMMVVVLAFVCDDLRSRVRRLEQDRPNPNAQSETR